MDIRKSRIKSNAKRIEREAARNLIKIDGEPKEEYLLDMMSSTGRIGHIPGMLIDCVSKHYGGEVKSSMSKAENPGHRITKETLKKVQRGAKKQNKHWIYIVHIIGCDEMHGISAKRHTELLEKERKLDEIQ